jgi:hypothetical protein
LQFKPAVYPVWPRQAAYRSPSARWIASIFGLILAALTLPTHLAAMPMTSYSSGPLEFSTTNQSMWGQNLSVSLSDERFFGAQWSNKSAAIGGIIGSRSTQTVNTNPLWWAWKGCKETVNFLCGSQPDPGDVKVVVDTRTGAVVGLNTSGKFGFELGYELDSGSVDANVTFDALASIPELVSSGDLVDLQTSSVLGDGLITTQSPTARAYVNAVASLQATVTAQGCLIALGCTSDSAQLANFDETLPLLEVNPNAIEILPEALPPNNPGEDRNPLLAANLFNQELTLQASLDAAGVPGFKLSSNFGTVVDTSPTGVPSVEIDLASLEFQVPQIQATGGVNGQSIKAEGRDDFLGLKADLDGVAALAGVLPPLGLGASFIDIGAGATNFKVEGSLDVLDVDVGPDLGFAQDFELKPTLWSTVLFSAPVLIGGVLMDAWTGLWDALPEIGLLKTTTVNPTFWLDNDFTHRLAIDLGLSGTMDLFKFGLTASLGGVKLLGGELSLNQIAGFGNTLFQTPRAEFEIWDTNFKLLGFSDVQGNPFVISVVVPEPSTWLLLLAGLVMLWLCRRRSAEAGASSWR